MADPDRRYLILVAEDDPSVRRMLQQLLRSIGDVEAVEDGLAAWERLQSGPLPSLIVTDLMMPRLDGLELVRQLKDHPEWSRIPVVMLTAKTRARDIVDGINAGARFYLTKPFKPEDLLAKVEKALGIKRAK